MHGQHTIIKTYEEDKKMKNKICYLLWTSDYFSNLEK